MIEGRLNDNLNDKNPNSEVRKPAFRLRSLLSLHRRMGIISALFVMLLSVSGLAIHHSPRLGLDGRFITSSAMLSWYGIKAPDITLGFDLGSHQAALIADAIYLDSKRLPGIFNSLTGAIEAEFGFVLATSDQLILLTEEGEVIEVLGSVSGVPKGMGAIGRGAANIYLKVGDDNLVADLNELSWTPVSISLPPDPIQWSVPVETATDIATEIKADYAGSLLSWDRLILDIHSGRFLGGLGVLLVDIMALLFMLMAISGVWIWSRRRS